MLWILNMGLLFIMSMNVYMCWALISQKHRSALIHKWLISWHGVERYASQPHCQIWCWPSAHENPPSTGAQAACPMCQVSSVKCQEEERWVFITHLEWWWSVQLWLMSALMCIIRADDFTYNLIGSKRVVAVRWRKFQFYFDVCLYISSAISIQCLGSCRKIWRHLM